MTFYSLDELNETIAQRVDDINMNMPRPDGLTRRELFDADEAPMMRDLPDTPFTEVSWRAVKVALPVLECIDFVSDVGGVDQAPQYVVVEVAEAEGYAA